jgi:hypothetical protein
MTYGAYSFSPVPLISYSTEVVRNGNGDVLAIEYTAQISGKLVSVPGGLYTIFELQNELREAFDCQQCQLFEIKCDEATLLSIRPNYTSLSFAEGNWIQTCDYTINLTWLDTSENNCPSAPYVKDTNNEWTLEPVQDPVVLTTFPDSTGCGSTDNRRLFTLTHNVSAVGIPYCDASGVRHEGYGQAREWVADNIGLDSTVIDMTGVFNNSGPYTAFDHFRSAVENRTNGSYSVTESWVIVDPSTSGLFFPAKESFTVEISEDVSNGLTTVNVNGTITGFENVNFSTGTVTKSRYENAITYWSNVEPRLLCRAQSVNTVECDLNLEPAIKTVGHSPTSGTITYNYVFNSRPSRLIPGSRLENIQLSYQNPSDIFAEHLVPGRRSGPVLQSLNTTTKSCQTVNIEVFMSGCGPTGCLSLLESPKSAVEENLLCCLESSLTGQYNQVFKTEDSESWDPINRRYSRTVTWCYQDCTGNSGSTSLCQS